MSRMKITEFRFKRGLIALLLLITLFSGAGRGEDVNQIIGKIKERYEEIKDFKADFLMISGAQRIEGKIWAKADYCKIKVILPSSEEGKKEEQIMIFDGKTIWQYISGENIVIKLDFPEKIQKKLLGKTQMVWMYRPFLEGNFKVRKRWQKNEEYYFLESVDSPQLKEFMSSGKISMWIRAKDYLMQKWEFYDGEGSLVLSQEFSYIEVNTGIPDKEFHLPPEAKVVDIFSYKL